jgi:Uma2 family endonuclease
VTVVCGQLATASDDPHGVTNPRVLIEVLSETTEGDDRGSKWSHYQRLESLEEFVLVSQDQARVEVYRRSGEIWTYRSIASGSVELESLGIAIALDELYENALGGG